MYSHCFKYVSWSCLCTFMSVMTLCVCKIRCTYGGARASCASVQLCAWSTCFCCGIITGWYLCWMHVRERTCKCSKRKPEYWYRATFPYVMSSCIHGCGFLRVPILARGCVDEDMIFCFQWLHLCMNCVLCRAFQAAWQALSKAV